VFWVRLTLAFSWLIACVSYAGAAVSTLMPESIPGALFVIALFAIGFAPLCLLIRLTNRVRNKTASTSPRLTTMAWEQFEAAYAPELEDLAPLFEEAFPPSH